MSLFFFSSRRRHTRSKRDWNSDVCSSDLPDCSSAGFAWTLGRADNQVTLDQALEHLRVVADAVKVPVNEIGRASCRERVEISVIVDYLNNNILKFHKLINVATNTLFYRS